MTETINNAFRFHGKGPLDGCRDFTNPDTFFDDCVYDVCKSNRELTHVCRNIEAFVNLCRRRGGNPGAWWTYVPECGMYHNMGRSLTPTI